MHLKMEIGLSRLHLILVAVTITGGDKTQTVHGITSLEMPPLALSIIQEQSYMTRPIVIEAIIQFFGVITKWDIGEVGMKRNVVSIIILLASIACCICGCASNERRNPLSINIGDPFHDAINAYRDEAQIVYRWSVAFGRTSDFLFAIGSENERVCQIAVYSLDGKLLYSEGGHVVSCSDILSQSVPVPLDEFESRFGVIPFDIGSGLNIPTYITDEASLACLVLEEATVTMIYEIDFRDHLDGKPTGLQKLLEETVSDRE